MTKDEIFNYYSANYHDYNKVKGMLNRIILDHEAEIKKLEEKLHGKSSKEIALLQETKKNVVKKELTEIGRVVALFDIKRKSIQPNYIRKEYNNIDGEYLLRVHLFETKRTPIMFIEAIQWLFSSNPKATFHRGNTMNIQQLINNFNKIEHDAMHSKESIKYSEEAQIWANVYKKKGFSDEEILEKLREGGYVS